MYVVMVEFTVMPGKIDAFRQRVRQQAEDSLNLEPACQVFDVCIDPDRAESLLLYEVYTNQSAFEDHLASDHFLRFDSDVRGMLQNKQVRILEKI